MVQGQAGSRDSSMAHGPAADGSAATEGPPELWLGLVCLAAGVLFFLSLERLWPLARLDLVAPASRIRAQAAEILRSRGFDLGGYRSSSKLTVRASTLDYVERHFGRPQAQAWISQGLPLAHYSAYFKKPGERTSYAVDLHPQAGVLGWRKSLEEDEPGTRIALDEARRLVPGAMQSLGLDLASFEERSSATTEQIARRDHSFGFERWWSRSPELREWVQVTVAGDQVAAVSRTLIVPGEARRAARAAEAPEVALETFGLGLVGAGVLAAFFIFLKRLRAGTARLGRSAIWPVIVALALLGTYALETAELFVNWEPLWPQWISNLRYLVFRAIEGAWLLLVLLGVVAAGDALDQASGAGRAAALWQLARGRVLDRGVVRASWRGFLIGLLCGGVMAASVTLLELLIGARTSIQPRGFFFYTLNSAAPAVTSLLFFLAVALIEELGYRFFAGSWILSLTRRRYLAVVLPACIYGLTHARLDFLPPGDPAWTRVLVLTAVGCVWGWAFLRYDALTVVLSHFTADLFIFNWPRLASGEPLIVIVTLLTIGAPLLPAILGFVARIATRNAPPPPLASRAPWPAG